jgi:hypothetical protein
VCQDSLTAAGRHCGRRFRPATGLLGSSALGAYVEALAAALSGQVLNGERGAPRSAAIPPVSRPADGCAAKQCSAERSPGVDGAGDPDRRGSAPTARPGWMGRASDSAHPARCLASGLPPEGPGARDAAAPGGLPQGSLSEVW